jgi:hypothetical protein
LGVALSLPRESALQDGQQVMNPVVGLGLAQMEVQAMHGLQRIGLLKDEDEKQFVFHLWQSSCGPTTDATLARLALQGLVRRIQRRIGGRKRREQTRKLCVRQSSRSEELSRSVLYDCSSASSALRGPHCPGASASCPSGGPPQSASRSRWLPTADDPISTEEPQTVELHRYDPFFPGECRA